MAPAFDTFVETADAAINAVEDSMESAGSSTLAGDTEPGVNAEEKNEAEDKNIKSPSQYPVTAPESCINDKAVELGLLCSMAMFGLAFSGLFGAVALLDDCSCSCTS
jgi:hypothetical protein